MIKKQIESIEWLKETINGRKRGKGEISMLVNIYNIIIYLMKKLDENNIIYFEEK